MSSKVLQIEEIKAIASEVARRHNLKKVDLFGSYADGNQTPKSDIDLLVEFVDDDSVSLFDLFRVEREFKKRFGKKVDVVCPPTRKFFFGNQQGGAVIWIETKMC